MNVLVPGGCGYVGSMLVPDLLADGHKVTVYDVMWFGSGYLPEDNANLKVIKGDVRDTKAFAKACKKKDAIIYLASLSSNDVCTRNKGLADSVNVEPIASVLAAARAGGVERFIYASSVAAYGSSDADAREHEPLKPTTPYAEAKKHCEHYVRAANEGDFVTIIARPASVCGFSLCQRFDLTVNMMVHDAMRIGRIKVNGGDQKRSHLHMQDMCRAYKTLLKAPDEIVRGETFNFVAQNLSVMETAIIVSDITDADIDVGPAKDNRSYTVDGRKARDVLGFLPQKGIAQAVRELKAHFDSDDLGYTHNFDGALTTWEPTIAAA